MQEEVLNCSEILELTYRKVYVNEFGQSCVDVGIAAHGLGIRVRSLRVACYILSIEIWLSDP